MLANYTVTNLSVKIIKKSKKLSGHTETYVLYVFLPPFLTKNNMRFYFVLFNNVRPVSWNFFFKLIYVFVIT